MSTANPSHTGESQGTQPLREKVEEVRHHAEEMGQHAQEFGACARDAAQEKIEELRGAASEYYGIGRERSQELVGQVENYIRQEPLKAIMIAAGAGALLGVLFLRR